MCTKSLALSPEPLPTSAPPRRVGGGGSLLLRTTQNIAFDPPTHHYTRPFPSPAEVEFQSA